jgi:flavin-binding protein dodecin
MAVIKTIDLVGVSSESWRDAAHQALAEAAKTIRGIESMDILGTSAIVADGQISEYHTQVRSASASSARSRSTARGRRTSWID